MNAPLYTTEILRLAASLPDPVPLAAPDAVAEQRSPTCGSRIRTTVRLDAQSRLEALSQEVEACAFGQASAALLARSAIGKSRPEVEGAVTALAAWLDGKGGVPGAWPGLTALEPARSRRSRHGAILLPFRALLAAMDQTPK